ncbi:MAG: DNA mismatch repair protein MutS [Actinomycetota bacterium]|nr:DNA mismatch repair protein MutS [Actinomycetota bacterium]
MRALLMFPDRDFEVAREDARIEHDVIEDLDLATLWSAMARGDEEIWRSSRAALLASLESPDEIRHRQAVYLDCLAHRPVIEELYQLAGDVIAEKKRSWRGIGVSSQHGEPLLHASMRELSSYVGILHRLHQLAKEQADAFSSDGFVRLFSTIRDELGDAYLAAINQHLRRLRFRDGMLASARLGEGNEGVDYVLRAPRGRGHLLRHPMMKGPTFSRTIAREDNAGGEALSGLRDRMVSLAANALAQSADHIVSFFTALRDELAFYLGCCNLHDDLLARGQVDCQPDPEPIGSSALAATGLYEPCLVLHTSQHVVANDLRADGRTVLVVTGANQGGKSTFLRSIGVAQLMMQAGMPVAAASFRTAIVRGVFTHFSREEDQTMTRGKFDEELQRMRAISGQLQPNALLLCNESFSSTNEREGSEIAAEIVGALNEAGVRVVFVTHLYELCRHLYERYPCHTLFLRAERRSDGSRPFCIAEAEPLATSFAKELYCRTFACPGTTADDIANVNAANRVAS